MRRREFIGLAAATAAFPGCALNRSRSASQVGYASPRDAMRAPREKLLYTVGIYTGTDIAAPDFLATIDADPASPNYSRVVHRLPMPYMGDELHHFGWNACSSCYGDPTAVRRFLVLPGLGSSRINIVDVAEPARPRMHKVIEAQEVADKAGLSAPHTVHCLASGEVMISMLGDRHGNGPGGFLLLDEHFDVAGRWERNAEGMKFNYDYWYQPRHNVMVSSEWGAPNTYSKGFDLKDVEAGKYGSRIHFWDWKNRSIIKSVDLGSTGMIPLEVRFHHDPRSTHGFVGAALSSTMWHWHRVNGSWETEKVIEVEPVEVEGWPFPVPGLITDLVLSMDDRYLYFSNWLQGDVRQYDVSDPSHPKLVGRVWCGGVEDKGPTIRGKKLNGGPQMLQLSLDGKRLYVTNSLLSSWDNQFYPGIKEGGSYLMQIDCDTAGGGLRINEDFFVDFGAEPLGPARAHEIRYPGGDCTSDIWI